MKSKTNCEDIDRPEVETNSNNECEDSVESICDWIGCEKSFDDNFGLEEHLDCSQATDKRKPFQCEYTDCQFESQSKSNLRQHFLSHKNILRLKCDESGCEMSFETNNY